MEIIWDLIYIKTYISEKFKLFIYNSWMEVFNYLPE